MKLKFSEYPADYGSYSFPYKVWALQDSDDERDLLLAQGFIPSRMKIGLWYVARSLRIDLSLFSENSENRRTIKNTSAYSFEVLDNAQVQITNSEIGWMGAFAQNVSKDSTYSKTSVKRVFSKQLSQNIFVWKKDDQVIGYVPVMVSNDSIFYWLGFYKDEAFVSGLGTRMMLEAIKWTQVVDRKYAYLGTIYTNSSLYKTNFDGWEFFDGFGWRNDKEQLKYMIGKDGYKDSPELLRDAEFCSRFYEGKIKEMLES